MIKILIAEHDATDLEMIQHELLRGGIKHIAEVVQNEPGFIHALETFIPDIILSGYTFPLFNGMTAFRIKEEICPDTPFILISGTIGEENSIELIKKGVTDFVLKDKIFTLNTKLARALKDAGDKKQKNKTDKELAQSQTHLAEAQRLAKMGSWDFDIEADRLTWSNELYNVFGVDNKKFSETHGSFINLVDEEDRLLVQQTSRHTRLTGDPFTIEYHITTSLGEKRIIREHGYGKKDDSGKTTNLFGTAQDITAAKKSEDAIKKAYDEANAVLESIDDGFFALDTNSVVTYWNKRAEILLDTKKEDLIGKNLYEVFLDRGSSIFYDNYEKALREKVTIQFEGFSNVSKKWFAVSAYGSDNGLSVFFKDVTELKNTGEKIKESELRYRSLIEQSTDSICILDAAGKFIEMNSSGCRMFGYSQEEILQLFMTDVFLEEDLKTDPIRMDELKAGKTTRNERRVKRKDGTTVEVELSAKMIEDGRIIAFGRDISARKESERLIKESEAKYRSFFESSMDGILLSIKDGEIHAANPAACEIFKMTEEEICTAGRLGIADHSDPRLYSLIEERKRTGRAKGEVTMLRKDGSQFQAEISSSVFTDSFDPERTSIILRDISERKAAENKLKESEVRYRSLIEQAYDAIFITDRSLKFLEVNSSACRLTGYMREELLQLSMGDLLLEEDLVINPIRITEPETGKAILNERRMRRKDGTVLEVELSVKLLDDGRVVTVGHDITERKESVRLIKESEAKFRAFFENSQDGILITDTDGNVLAVNHAACEMFGMTVEEICRAGRNGLVNLGDPRVPILMQKRRLAGKARGELTYIRKDGSSFPGEISCVMFRDSFGKEQISTILRDVSERKAAEFNLTQTSKELQNTLNDLTKIMGSSMDIICTVDDAGKFVQVSAASQAIWGYSPQELIDINYTTILYADDIEKSTTKDIQIKNGAPVTMFENRFIHKNGSIVPMLWSANWDENDQLMYCIGKDATEKKRLEKANEIERQRFLGLYLQAPSCMGILKGPNHVYEMANPLYLKLIDKKDIIGKTVKEVLPEMESQGILEILDNVYKTGNTFSANEMLVKLDVKGTGELVDTYLNFIYQAHRNNEGETDGIVFFVNDVTEQVLSRKKIEESEKEIRSMAESMPQIVWVTNAQGENTYFNQQWMDYTGLTPEESHGAGWIKPFHREDRTMAWEAWKNAVETLGEYAIECRLQCYDGSYRWWLMRGVPKINDNGEILKWYGTCTDIENIKQTEEKLKKQAKDLAISNTELEQFAYVASHDLQEPLRMVTGFITLLQKKYGKDIDDKGKQYIQFAVEGAGRMRNLILDLLEFSKVGKSEDMQEDVDLNELVDEIQILFRKEILEEKAVIISTPLPIIPGYRSPMRQVFQNLISNALKYKKKDRAARINITCTELKDHWQFAVHDNGIGIEKEYFDRIFIIFQRLHNNNEFSGTGMGLALTKKIIESRGGRIWVESEVGKGSTFYFTLLKLNP